MDETTTTPGDPILQAIKRLEANQNDLRFRFETMVNKGGAFSKLSNEVLEVTAEVRKALPAIESRLTALDRSTRPARPVERVLLVVGAVVVTNVLLGLFGVRYPAQPPGCGPSSFHEGGK